MILNQNNTIYTQHGVENEELLKSDQAIIYQSPSKIKHMGYTGMSDKIVESSTINAKYFDVLKKMKGFISLGSTGTGEDKEYKNIHLYSEKATYLDGINRIGYLYKEGEILRICEYKKGTRGSRYSSLYKIIEQKLKDKGFVYENGSFIIDLDNITTFVSIINEVNEEQQEDKYCLVKSKEVDRLKLGIFNIAYWRFNDDMNSPQVIDKKSKLNIHINEWIKNIDKCNDLNELTNLEKEIEVIYEFCKSKINAMKLIQ